MIKSLLSLFGIRTNRSPGYRAESPETTMNRIQTMAKIEDAHGRYKVSKALVKDPALLQDVEVLLATQGGRCAWIHSYDCSRKDYKLLGRIMTAREKLLELGFCISYCPSSDGASLCIELTQPTNKENNNEAHHD